MRSRKHVPLGIVAVTALCAMVAAGASAQSVVNDLLGGKLIEPRVGQWAWYDLTDAASGKRYVVRQAVVGEEKVGRKSGYWVEFEVVPEVGYSLFYKALVTGPTSDPDNIHRLIAKTGPDEPKEAEIDRDAKETRSPEPKRRSLGAEDVATGSGVLRAERLEVTQGERKFDVWVNDEVRPTGVVKLATPDGEMLLRSHGMGGEFAKSIIDGNQRSADVEVTVRVAPPDGGEAAPGAPIPTPTQPAEPESKAPAAP